MFLAITGLCRENCKFLSIFKKYDSNNIMTFTAKKFWSWRTVNIFFIPYLIWGISKPFLFSFTTSFILNFISPWNLIGWNWIFLMVNDEICFKKKEHFFFQSRFYSLKSYLFIFITQPKQYRKKSLRRFFYFLLF